MDVRRSPVVPLACAAAATVLLGIASATGAGGAGRVGPAHWDPLRDHSTPTAPATRDGVPSGRPLPQLPTQTGRPVPRWVAHAVGTTLVLVLVAALAWFVARVVRRVRVRRTEQAMADAEPVPVVVDLTHVIRTADDRMALFMEPGDPPMPGRVTYDRMHTPFREITPEAFDWDSLLDTRLLFVTGITAALTENTARTVTHAVTEAHARGVKVALDVDYRAMLWTPQQAREVLEPLLPMTDLLFCSRLDAQKVFDVKGQGIEVTRALHDQYQLDEVVSTDGVNGVYYCGTGGEKTYQVETVPVTDRPGAGDSFVGGCLHGYLHNDLAAGIGYGLRTSKFALTHHGDLTHISPSELDIPTTTDIMR